MTDIYMKNTNLPMENGDFMLTNGTEEVKQHITVSLNTFLNDWLLDSTKGIDYANGLRHTEFLEHDVKNQIQGVNGVREIKSFKMTFDNQVIKITAEIATEYGIINLQNTIKGDM